MLNNYYNNLYFEIMQVVKTGWRLVQQQLFNV